MLDTPMEKKKLCKSCGRYLPIDALFFVRNRSRKDGFSGTCKECEKKKRIERGG
jgi:RNase P subunit RPR2